MRPLPGDTPEAVLLRLPAPAGWARDLPPVPLGFRVSVSVSSLDGLRAQPELEARGYSFVGVHHTALPRAATDVADLLVAGALAHAHPRWWRTLAARADRVLSLSFGPVRAMLGDLLEAHLTSVRPSPGVGSTPPLC
ncbi:MAG TPA: hypothetical protein VHF25_07535 [Nitriliruptorales bacterium]|nr:hypothetical protein [Nitriliruptorales bacterium]